MADLQSSSADYGVFEEIFNHSGLGIALVDFDGSPARTNPAFQRMLGYGAAELRAMRFDEFTHAEDRDLDRKLFNELIRGERTGYQIEKRFIRKDGQTVWSRLTASLLDRVVLGIVEDITGRKGAEEALERQHAYFEQLFQGSPHGVALVDRHDRILRVNRSFTHMFGYSEEEALERETHQLIAPVEHRREALALTLGALGGETISIETTRCRKDGTPIDVALSSVPVRLHGEINAVYGIYQDITAQKEALAALERLSTTDPLTGLLNRRGLGAFIEKELTQTEDQERAFLLLYIDVDRLKEINDQWGHAEGDRVLQAIAALLKRCLRGSDGIARLGGDEFVVLATDARKSSEAIILTRIVAAVDQLNQNGGHPYPTSLSIGVHRVRAGAFASMGEILEEADRRMYAEKWSRRAPSPTSHCDHPGGGGQRIHAWKTAS